MKLFLPLAITLMFQGCAHRSPVFDENFNKLSANMRSTEVVNLLGNPDLKELKDGVETWHYNKNDGRYVQIREEKVIGFGRETPTLSAPASQASTPVLVALKIGASCDHDEQCQSSNCHFHKCAGPNNCNVPEGGVCATDNDCCTSLCDFGICRKRH